MGSVFVLNSHSKQGLDAIRSLGSRGLWVTAGSHLQWNAGRLSKFADRFLRYPPPEEDPLGFVRAVESELEVGEYDVLLPINETTVDVVVRNRSRFEQHANVPFLPYEQLLVGFDKRRTVEAARDIGVPQPETLFSDETSLDTVEEVLGYPVVVKSRRGSGGSGVSVCESYDDLERATRRLERTDRHPIFQEFIPNGGERGVYTLYDRSGELVGLTVQHRLRTRPPGGGVSTYRETVENPALVELADEFLTRLDWRGPAMAEFRIDARTGEPKLLEMNPRLWGSLALSTYAGVDFPYMLYQLAVGEDPEPALDYEVGVRARCLFTDGLQVLEREDRLRALREFLTPSARPCRYDIVSAQDPLPTLGQLGYWASIAYDALNGATGDADGGERGVSANDDAGRESPDKAHQ